jgi:SecD/SecF fusion protein
MSGKYLWLKFASVGLLVLICLGSIFYGDGLKMGADIAGGYSMIFEIREVDSPNAVNQTISVLKKRLDPSGLSSLEFRPLQNNRFEIRMPAASEDSQTRRNEYQNALEDLLDTNIQPSDIRAAQALSGEARQGKLDELATGSDARREVLAKVVSLADELDAANTRLQELQNKTAAAENLSEEQIIERDKQLQAARNVRAEAMDQYRETYDQLLETNINPMELHGLRAQYIEAQAKRREKDRQAAMENYQGRLERLLERYPGREDMLREVMRRFEDWVAVRRPLEDPGDVIRMIRKSGVLEFRIAPKVGELTNAQVGAYRNRLRKEGPEGSRRDSDEYQWFPLLDEEGFGGNITEDFAGRRYVLLSNKAGETLLKGRPGEPQWSLKSAQPSMSTGRPSVLFTMSPVGARLFGELTSQNVDKQMAILLDDEVYSAPNIQSAISDSGQITGRFTRQEVEDLVQILNAGSLTGKVSDEPVSQTSFSPALGAVAIEKGKQAAIIGLIAVAIFMVLYYLLPGFVADLALLLNLTLMLGFMSLFQAVLTLPGIAGVILTIGIAVDANVLIFERLREEQKKGIGLRQAMKNAYERAFSAILDANLTTLLICLFLFVVFGSVGMEEIRGFAITLGLGVAFSMFSALVFTRWIFQVLLNIGVLKDKVVMLRLVPKVNVNWMQKRYMFWIVSAALLVSGVTALVWQGRNVLGIEFSSGTQAVMRFKDDVVIDGNLLDDAVVRQRFHEHAEGNDRLLTARVEEQIDEDLQQQFLSMYDADGNDAISKAEWSDAGKNMEFFALVDENDDGVLDAAELSRLPQRNYQVTTTETDVKVVEDVIDEAFGKQELLQRRIGVEFSLADSGTVMGLPMDADGVTRLTAEATQAVANPTIRDEVRNYEGGIAMVVQDAQPAMSVAELRQRIRDFRMKPDFGRLAVNPYQVLGLKSNEEGKFTSFLVLVNPANPTMLTTDDAWENFQQNEKDLLVTALQSEEAIPAMNFDPTIAAETAQLAIVVVVLSWLTIIVYLWLRFGSARWGLAAVVCLVHDVVIVVGLVAASAWIYDRFGSLLGIAPFKIDLPMVAAILTVIGYSVNDTIVVFDRIRENRGKLKYVTGEIINDSINQTLPRTLLTSFTTLIVVFIMYVWGGPGLKSFNYALLTGIIFGTYSSVAIASPLLLGVKQAIVAKVAHPNEVNDSSAS